MLDPSPRDDRILKLIGLILLFALVGMAAGIMGAIGMAILSGAPLTATADVAPVTPSPGAGSYASGALPTPTLAPTPPPTPDARPPEIIGRTPKPNATNVAGGSSIRIQFSEPVQGVSGATVRLRNVAGGWLVRSTVHYDTASRTATLSPVRLMYRGTKYRVEILSGITDQSGNRLTPARWTFRVASR